jgi:hypothetical protein
MTPPGTKSTRPDGNGGLSFNRPTATVQFARAYTGRRIRQSEFLLVSDVMPGDPGCLAGWFLGSARSSDSAPRAWFLHVKVAY